MDPYAALNIFFSQKMKAEQLGMQVLAANCKINGTHEYQNPISKLQTASAKDLAAELRIP